MSYNSSELRMGIQTEMEHTSDPKEAAKIAKDHLDEDPRYYSHLKQCKAMSKHSRSLPEAWCVVHYSDGFEVYGPYSRRSFAIDARINLINRVEPTGIEGSVFNDDTVISSDHEHEFSVVSMNSL